jgi:hypothetical protein
VIPGSNPGDRTKTRATGYFATRKPKKEPKAETRKDFVRVDFFKSLMQE